MKQDRLVVERRFHDSSASNTSIRHFEERFYFGNSRRFVDKYLLECLGNLRDKIVLEFGCGISGYMFRFASQGAHVVAIDLSHESLIRTASSVVRRNLAERVQLVEMDGERMGFKDGSFEVVFGSGILHHLDMDRASREIARILTLGGKGVFVEPVGMNPLINVYRRLTPNSRTPDERPITDRDLHTMERHFKNLHSRSFLFLSLAALFWRVIVKNDFIFDFVLRKLHALDQVLFRFFPFLSKFSWITVITVYK